MPPIIQDVTPAELAILQELWIRREATVRELTERIYPEQSVSDFATVQKLLKRLEQKECVTRREGTWPHVFEPTLSREGLIQRRLQKTANDLCDGDLNLMLAPFVKGPLVSDGDLGLSRNPVCESETHSPPSSSC